MKRLYALAFVFLSFTASAQTPDPATMMFSYLDDYFGEITESSTLPPPAVASDLMITKSGETADDTNGTEDVAVATILPSNENASAPSPIWWDDNLSFEDVVEPGTMPAQIAPEATADTLGEASGNGDSVAIAEAADVPVGEIEPRHDTAMTSGSPSEHEALSCEAIDQSEPAVTGMCQDPAMSDASDR